MEINRIWLAVEKAVLYAFSLFVLLSILFVGLLKYFPVPISAFMLYRQFEDLQHEKPIQPVKFYWVSGNKISDYAKSAVIAAEDQLFFKHSGFDFKSIHSAVDSYLAGGRLRGASTISQQVAKNLFLIPAKSLWRKAIEAWFTLLIELFWSKQRILEVYLNIAEFGDHLFGIEAASRHYFAIPAKDLPAEQAALLAAILPNPLRYSAENPTSYLQKRQQWILQQMKNLNYLH